MAILCFLDQLQGPFQLPHARKIAPQDVRLAVDMGDKVGQCGCQLKLAGPSVGVEPWISWQFYPGSFTLW